MSQSKEDVLRTVIDRMTELFQPETPIEANSQLFTDLDLDSIDAVELAVKLEDMTGQRVPEDALRSLRTVDDVANLVVAMQAKRTDMPST